MQGLNIEQRDCAIYHFSQSFRDCSGRVHITANTTGSAKLSVEVAMSKDEAYNLCS